MAPPICVACSQKRAQILRPSNHQRICATCFISLFESEVYEVITSHALFTRGERIAIGASGGKDSCVLAAVLHTLNQRHDLGLDLVLLSIDEGITGYRDHSLDAVRRNAAALGLPLHILSYKELYGWSMDQVVAQIGKKGNCTYCGVFRRQALDRGASSLGVRHVVTGHNADDVAETVLMNLLRGDVARLGRTCSIVTSTPGEVKDGGDQESSDGVRITDVKRSKPLMYAYEKEIVLYAHHRKLDYFSTECIYSPEAFRGSARTLIKNLERIRPEAILDIVRSGIDMARMVPGAERECAGACGSRATPGLRTTVPVDDDDGRGGCGSNASGPVGEVSAASTTENPGAEVEIILPPREQTIKTVPIRRKPRADAAPASDEKKLGRCERCGYLSSQKVCKACVLLDGLNKARPRTAITIEQGV